MLIQSAAQCGYLHTAFQMLAGGWLSSLGFMVNMLIAGAAFQAYRKYRDSKPPIVKEDVHYSGVIHDHASS